MILDDKKAVSCYKDAVMEMPGASDRFHELVNPLIEIIACSLVEDHDTRTDLIQEAHLKLRLFVANDTYEQTKSSMYTFLSRTLRNNMLDWLRKRNRYDRYHYNPDDQETSYDEPPPIDPNELMDFESLKDYMSWRFPSLHVMVIEDATEYVGCSILEGTCSQGRRIIRTLEHAYPFNHHQAYIFYHSLLIYLRSYASQRRLYEDAALTIAKKGSEFTLVPETALLLGDSKASRLVQVFSGCYVKF
jgi:hypothetical protein